MTKPSDHFSIRNKLRDAEFELLSPKKYLELLEIKVGKRSGDPRKAKEELFNASFRLIVSQIRKVLEQAQANAGFEQAGIDIEGPSDLFNAMAGTVWKDLSKMAVKADEHEVHLFAIIKNRVAHRLYSRFRTAAADKRSAEFDCPEVLTELTIGSIEALEQLLLDEFHAEFQTAVENELDETAREVVKGFYFGIMSGQHLPISKIASSLQIPESTAKSALARAREKLKSSLENYRFHQERT